MTTVKTEDFTDSTTENDVSPESDDEFSGRLSCPLCSNFRNVTESELKDHMWQHSLLISDSPENPFRMKLVAYNQVVRRRFCCSLCTNTYSDQNELKNHLQTHARRPSRPNIRVNFFSPPRLNPNPTPPARSKSSKFKCAKCTLTFNKLIFLKRHMRTHDSKKAAP